MTHPLAGLWSNSEEPQRAAERWLAESGYADPARTSRRLRQLVESTKPPATARQCLEKLLLALLETSSPDGALNSFERFVQQSPHPDETFAFLNRNPRAIEILVKLFVGSQYLTETLLRTPAYLERLTQHRSLADLKNREEFFLEALASTSETTDRPEQFDALRRYQRWEILRIGASDAFALFDLRSATRQLSLLADAFIRAALWLIDTDHIADRTGFCVLGLGKLGGEELNYSSDIDLIFLAEDPTPEVVQLAQQLIRALQSSTSEGFLYRVDMRLRPWGRSGSLVSSPAAFLEYLHKHGELWEKQALLKARIVAGSPVVGRRVMQSLEPVIFGHPAAALRESVRGAKRRIENELARQGKAWGEVKSGSGSIRDIEFLAQFLQMVHGERWPQVRTANTLEALIRLTDFNLLQADEFRVLTGGYLFLRTIEHSLQLMHNKQAHALPSDPRELGYLAQRLDFPGPQEFVDHYDRHCVAVRRIYDKFLGDDESQAGFATVAETADGASEPSIEPTYTNRCLAEERKQHARWLESITVERPVRVVAVTLPDASWRVTVLGVDHPGDLSAICGLMFVYGFDIVEGVVSTGQHPGVWSKLPRYRRSSGRDETPVRDFVNVFTVRPPWDVVPEVWLSYESDLTELFLLARTGRDGEAQGRLAKRVAAMLDGATEAAARISPVEVSLDNERSPRATVLEIRADDTLGFLYELTNALALTGLDIEQVVIHSDGARVSDVLWVVDGQHGGKITDPVRQQELKAAVVLIKHFTHLLPKSPNPEAALLHFRGFLRQLFQQPNWLDELTSLERPDTLDALAQLLGVSDFLWDDFLRLQYANIFPLLRDLSSLQQSKSRTELETELRDLLHAARSADEQIEALNAYKDREMFRVDMRHILGRIRHFDQFSAELTDVAEVVVSAATTLVMTELHARHGVPRTDAGGECALAVCALGKCGGRELGFASDIELLFVYAADGRTDGREAISNATFFQRVVERFTQVIHARREGIFHIDLRLRPYGAAGNLAVAMAAFRSYFASEGAAWPYERQALVKLRPLAGDEQLGREIVRLRDELIYTRTGFDFAAMRAMRERQFRQLVRAGTFHAKLSPGGLVDLEYLVQALQIEHGHLHPQLREPNTYRAAAELCRCGLLSGDDHARLEAAYTFLRRLIDALRMVRGDARDLTVPTIHSEEFEFLARRLGYGGNVTQLQHDLEAHSAETMDLVRRYTTPTAATPVITPSETETA